MLGKTIILDIGIIVNSYEFNVAFSGSLALNEFLRLCPQFGVVCYHAVVILAKQESI